MGCENGCKMGEIEARFGFFVIRKESDDPPHAIVDDVEIHHDDDKKLRIGTMGGELTDGGTGHDLSGGAGGIGVTGVVVGGPNQTLPGPGLVDPSTGAPLPLDNVMAGGAPTNIDKLGIEIDSMSSTKDHGKCYQAHGVDTTDCFPLDPCKGGAVVRVKIDDSAFDSLSEYEVDWDPDNAVYGTNGWGTLPPGQVPPGTQPSTPFSLGYLGLSSNQGGNANPFYSPAVRSEPNEKIMRQEMSYGACGERRFVGVALKFTHKTTGEVKYGDTIELLDQDGKKVFARLAVVFSSFCTPCTDIYGEPGEEPDEGDVPLPPPGEGTPPGEGGE